MDKTLAISIDILHILRNKSRSFQDIIKNKPNGCVSYKKISLALLRMMHSKLIMIEERSDYNVILDNTLGKRKAPKSKLSVTASGMSFIDHISDLED